MTNMNADRRVDDIRFLEMAVERARVNIETGRGGPFGAVVVKAGEVIGLGENRVVASLDPTAHAEVVAIRAATQRVGSPHLDGATLYTSCEPCPMCLGAAYWAHIGRIVHALDRADAERMGFDDRWMYDEFAMASSGRRIPVCHVASDAGLRLVTLWNESPLKRSY